MCVRGWIVTLDVLKYELVYPVVANKPSWIVTLDVLKFWVSIS